MTSVTHSLVGYDRLTERVAAEFDVPDSVLLKAKRLAGVPADDADAVMCYALEPSRARNLANLLKVPIDPQRYDYFLEGFASDRAAQAKAKFEEDRTDKGV